MLYNITIIILSFLLVSWLLSKITRFTENILFPGCEEFGATLANYLYRWKYSVVILELLFFTSPIVFIIFVKNYLFNIQNYFLDIIFNLLLFIKFILISMIYLTIAAIVGNLKESGEEQISIFDNFFHYFKEKGIKENYFTNRLKILGLQFVSILILCAFIINTFVIILIFEWPLYIIFWGFISVPIYLTIWIYIKFDRTNPKFAFCDKKEVINVKRILCYIILVALTFVDVYNQFLSEFNMKNIVNDEKIFFYLYGITFISCERLLKAFYEDKEVYKQNRIK